MIAKTPTHKKNREKQTKNSIKIPVKSTTKKKISSEVSKGIIVIDMRAYRQMTGFCKATNAGQCETVRSTKEPESRFQRKIFRLFENNKGLAKQFSRYNQMPTAY